MISKAPSRLSVGAAVELELDEGADEVGEEADEDDTRAAVLTAS